MVKTKQVIIPDEELIYLTDGIGDEGDKVKVIKQYLLTGKQKLELYKLGLSIEDVLNGRYPANNKSIKNLLLDWNKALKQDIFFVL